MTKNTEILAMRLKQTHDTTAPHMSVAATQEPWITKADPTAQEVRWELSVEWGWSLKQADIVGTIRTKKCAQRAREGMKQRRQPHVLNNMCGQLTEHDVQGHFDRLSVVISVYLYHHHQ